MMKNIITPIAVDLDGTLARTDFLQESLILFIKQNPLNLFRVAWWALTQSREAVKARIARSIDMDVASIPWNRDVVAWLGQEKMTGREVVLATASHRKYAMQVAAHLDLFDEVLASSDDYNLKGSNKEKALVEKYGEGGFVYAGDSRADLKVWRSAESAVTVNLPYRLRRQVEQVTAISKAFGKPASTADYLNALHPRQWIWNLLVFLPLLAARPAGSFGMLVTAVFTFLAFSLCASSVQIVDDLIDLSEDRAHPDLKARPFASGDLGIAAGVVLTLACLGLSLAIAVVISPVLLVVLAGYFFLAVLYSLYFRQRKMLDVVVLAGLLAFRILAGMVAIGVGLSSWLLVFSAFSCLGLAFTRIFRRDRM